jgi:hypothetical protein
VTALTHVCAARRSSPCVTASAGHCVNASKQPDIRRHPFYPEFQYRMYIGLMNERGHIDGSRSRCFKTDVGQTVFITLSRLENILNKIPVQNLAALTGELYKRPIFIFSDRERMRLMAVKSFFEDTDGFINSFWQPATWGQHPYYVFEDEQPVYHLHKSCSFLHADYNNIEIPAHIRNCGDAEIARFKKWAEINKSVFLQHPERFKLMVCNEFNIKPQELNLIFFKNSGAVGVVNENCNAISIRIDTIIRAAGRFYYACPKNTAILRQYQKWATLGYETKPLHSNRTGYPDNEVKELLRYYNETFKKPLKKLLISYFCIRYNPELNFSGYLLEQLGLRCCEACRKAITPSNPDDKSAVPTKQIAAVQTDKKTIAAQKQPEDPPPLEPARHNNEPQPIDTDTDYTFDDNTESFANDDVFYV